MTLCGLHPALRNAIYLLLVPAAAALVATSVRPAAAQQPIPSCLAVPSKGKPPCPEHHEAICTERVTCLNKQFPATTAKPCVKWVCEELKAKKSRSAMN